MPKTDLVKVRAWAASSGWITLDINARDLPQENCHVSGRPMLRLVLNGREYWLDAHGNWKDHESYG